RGRRNFGQPRLEVVPDRQRVDESPFAVGRGDEAVLTVLLFNDLPESRRDLEPAFLVDLGGRVAHQDIQFHELNVNLYHCGPLLSTYFHEWTRPQAHFKSAIVIPTS